MTRSSQRSLRRSTPAGVRACTEAVGELERQHEERLAGHRLAVERAEFEARAGRAAVRRLRARESSRRAHAGASVRSRRSRDWSASDKGLPNSTPAAPSPLTAAERQALARLARDLPRLWDAETTTARDRKELLRTLVGEVIVTVNDDPRRAEVEIVWEGGARTKLQVPLIRRGVRAPAHQRGHRRSDPPARRRTQTTS